MAAMGLLTDNAITTGSMIFDGQDLLHLDAANQNKICGFTMAI
jgi:ABC-type glutathione transport system ATPase component